MDVNKIMETVMTIGIAFGLKAVGAIVIWVVGRYLIGLAVRLVSASLERQKVDPTVLRYLGTVISVTLNIVLVIAILGYFGVETTTFAAIMASAGVAIGLAWSGLLGNFAAGAFMIVLRPIKVGDFVTAGGLTGTVKEIGLFVTVINTPDNVSSIVGNNKIFSDIIQNFSVNPYRRVDRMAQLNHSRRSQCRYSPSERKTGEDSKRQVRSGAGRRDPGFQSRRSGAGCATLLPHRLLLAGLLRYQPGDSRNIWRRGIPGSGAAFGHSGWRGGEVNKPREKVSSDEGQKGRGI